MKPSIYLDSSVISHLYADDAPEMRAITQFLFEKVISKNKCETYISRFVILELQNTVDLVKREKFLHTVKSYSIEMLETEEEPEINRLVTAYRQVGIAPDKKIIDLYHIAIAVVNEIDYLISWNYKHLANIRKEDLIKSVNFANNRLKAIKIITPEEFLDYEI